MQEGSLLYLEEHKACVEYLNEIDTGFMYREHKEGDRWNFETSRNYLVIVLHGKIRLTCDVYKNQEVGDHEMFLISKTSMVYSECVEDAGILSAAFYIPENSCEKLSFLALSKIAHTITDYHLDTLPVRPTVELFCRLEIQYLSMKGFCRHLHKAKLDELFYCLRFCYTKEELVRLFYPMISRSPDFQSFVLDNYRKVKSVKELVSLSCMEKTAFYKTFANTFGIPPKQWLRGKLRERMSVKAAEPGMTVKQLMNEFDFDSLSAFQIFCKLHFGCTPSRFIEDCQKENARFCGEQDFI